MSDEKDAAVRRAAEGVYRLWQRATVAPTEFSEDFNEDTVSRVALDASGVWERIEVLDGRTVALADGWRFCAETNAKLRAENERLREALARILDEAGVLKLGGVRRVARAALAETR